MSKTISSNEALLKVAESLEKLANSLEVQEERQKTASAEKVADFGSLGANNYSGYDALTKFLLEN